MKKENLKASRAAAELSFMLAQASLNIEFLEAKDAALFDQAFSNLYHDISVLARRAGNVNSEIIQTYEKRNAK